MSRVSVEEHLKRLDDIVTRLQSGEAGLDEALRLFEQGVTHLRVAEAAIAKAELRVEEILASGSSHQSGSAARQSGGVPRQSPGPGGQAYRGAEGE